eukprot:353069-Chlamydomonas_euryale.AAC.7
MHPACAHPCTCEANSPPLTRSLRCNAFDPVSRVHRLAVPHAQVSSRGRPAGALQPLHQLH